MGLDRFSGCIARNRRWRNRLQLRFVRAFDRPVTHPWSGVFWLCLLAPSRLACQVIAPPPADPLPKLPGSDVAARRIANRFVFQKADGEIVVSYPDPSDTSR